MSVEIRFFGLLRKIIGKKKIQVPISKSKPSLKLKDILFIIFEEFPKLKNEILNEAKDSFKSNYRLLLNSKEITFKNPLEIEINDNDILQFFPPISGG